MRDTFPYMFKLVLFCLIPTSTALVERIFRPVNCICTENGNRLGQDTLCALMKICRHGSQSLTPLQVSKLKNQLLIHWQKIPNLFDFDAIFSPISPFNVTADLNFAHAHKYFRVVCSNSKEMVKNCCVYKCRNVCNADARSRGLSFFRFPKDKRNRRVWINQTSIHGFVPVTFFTGGTEMTQVMTITAPHCLRTKTVDLRKILKGKRDG